MLKISSIYKVIALCIFVGGNTLFAQKSFLYKERMLLKSTGILEGNNPIFLQNVTDSILFTAKANYSFKKGDFVNYYEGNTANTWQISTDSYNRINDKIVLYGLANYRNKNQKNSGGSSFLYPEKMPFDFIEKDRENKGKSRVEGYQLIGAMSYRFNKRFDVGLKIDYQALSFGKFKDMRNINDILDLKFGTGIGWHLAKGHTWGISYNYKRYIEGLVFMQEGDKTIDHYALVNKGAFMGLMYLYGKYGILKIERNTPWVAIAHNLGMQYQLSLGSNFNSFFSCSYEKEKGYFGKEGNASLVYFRHNRKTYEAQIKLVKEGETTHILEAKVNVKELINKEMLYKQYTTAGGSSFIDYYGENEIFQNKKMAFDLEYNCLVGKTYLKAPWHFNLHYQYRNRKNATIFYPFFRKQKIAWQHLKFGITHLFALKNTDFALGVSSLWGVGNGGERQDGNYLSEGQTANNPDYMNELLEIEKEFLTSEKCIPEISLRAERKLNSKVRIFATTVFSYTRVFNNSKIKGNTKIFHFAVGVAF